MAEDRTPDPSEIHLVRDVLDKQLVGRRHRPMGRADGAIMVWHDGEQPCIPCIESGLPVAGRRLHPRLAKWIAKIGRRWGVRRGRVFRIPWRLLRPKDIEVNVDTTAGRSEALAWERWLRRNVIGPIPGSGRNKRR